MDFAAGLLTGAVAVIAAAVLAYFIILRRILG